MLWIGYCDNILVTTIWFTQQLDSSERVIFLWQLESCDDSFQRLVPSSTRDVLDDLFVQQDQDFAGVVERLGLCPEVLDRVALERLGLCPFLQDVCLSISIVHEATRTE